MQSDANGVALACWTEDAVDAALTALELPIREAAPEALRCKTLGLVGEGHRAVALLSAGAQLSLRKAAEALGVPELQLAKQRDLPELFGFQVGRCRA